MIWSISWKNVWRNKTRSLTVIIAITIGLWGGVFAIGVMDGMINRRVRAAINNEISHIQIHHPKFSDNNDMKYTIDNAENVLDDIQKMPEVKAAVRRTKITAMANTATNSAGVFLVGIKPGDEIKITDIHEKLVDTAGTYFDSDRRNPIIIGEKLAETLKLINYKITDKALQNLIEKNDIDEETAQELKPIVDSLFRKKSDFIEALNTIFGEEKAESAKYYIENASKIYRIRSKVVTTLQSANNNLTGGAFRVTGIYKTTNSMFDQMNAFVLNEDLTRITGFDKSKAHEIAILLNDREKVPEIVNKLRKKYPDYEIKSWKAIQPELAMQTDYINMMYYIFIIFILAALGFGIVNTMLMVVLERIKELGMLMAVGMNKLRVFMMIMLETVFLSLTGGIVGMVLGALSIWITGNTGLDLRVLFGEGLAALGYSAHIFPTISWDIFFGVAGLVILTGIVASVYPARKALKLNPAEATRIDV